MIKYKLVVGYYSPIPNRTFKTNKKTNPETWNLQKPTNSIDVISTFWNKDAHS